MINGNEEVERNAERALDAMLKVHNALRSGVWESMYHANLVLLFPRSGVGTSIWYALRPNHRRGSGDVHAKQPAQRVKEARSHAGAWERGKHEIGLTAKIAKRAKGKALTRGKALCSGSA
jgi:hypothetical protein